MKRLFFILIVSLFTILSSCKDHYNEAIQWTEGIKRGTDIEAVKRCQPDFLEVAWDMPDTVNNQIRYEITQIKGNNDNLKMQHFLLFIDNKYQGRASIK